MGSLQNKPLPKRKGKCKRIKKDAKTKNTVLLLDAIYNGTTQLKILEASNIRDNLQKEILHFYELLNAYFDEETEEEERVIFFRKIIKQLKITSAFTIFKRWIIKDNPTLLKYFGKYIS